MVTLKVDFAKKDFTWIVLLIVFVGIGFVFAYGGNQPNIMGHSAGEIKMPWSEITNKPTYDCGAKKTIRSINFETGEVVCENATSSTTLKLDLIYGQHSSEQCSNLGGSVEASNSSKFCKFNQTSCSPGWTKYKSWSETTPNTCEAFNIWTYGRFPYECTTDSHPFSNTDIESCKYYDGDDDSGVWKDCYAKITQIGCY